MKMAKSTSGMSTMLIVSRLYILLIIEYWLSPSVPMGIPLPVAVKTRPFAYGMFVPVAASLYSRVIQTGSERWLSVLIADCWPVEEKTRPFAYGVSIQL